jgi:hypothetical protein
MAYPTYKQSYESSRTPRIGLITDEGGNNTTWVRSTGPKKWDFTLVHFLTASELASLTSFCDTNKTTPFDLVYRDDMTTYTNCIVVDGPKPQLISRGSYRVTVSIKQL